MVSASQAENIMFVDIIFVSLLWGGSFVLFWSTLRELLTASSPSKRMVALVLALFSISTTGVVANLFGIVSAHKMVDALEARNIVTPPDSDNNPAIDWEKYTSPAVKLTAYAAYLTCVVLADAVLVYRCFRVWRSKRVIILPSFLWTGLLVAAVGTQVFATLSTYAKNRTVIEKGWFIFFLCMSLSTNLLTTGFLAYKIYRMDRGTAEFRPTSSFLKTVLRVILESGIIYSVTLVVGIALCIADSPYQKIPNDTIIIVIPITFYLIILRLGQARHANVDGTASSLAFKTSASYTFRTRAASNATVASFGPGPATRSFIIQCPSPTQTRARSTSTVTFTHSYVHPSKDGAGRPGTGSTTATGSTILDPCAVPPVPSLNKYMVVG
ncbi:hypothetical protein V5O48_002978 [Marasmius crinis-equi]|uniref:Transmembrane protein n=1 Tax=Marasmius crinis-equi TaxID=585013 RepID=A0ABR3FU94_9AGAR